MTTRRPLRDEIRQQILERLLHGNLPPESRIKEVSLARELGVSRTPLREALFQLEQEGFVQADMDRGFRVVPLTAREVREIYPIIWTLEGLALRSAGLAAAAHHSELEHINRALFEERNHPARTLELDTNWHRLLLQPCPNRHLLRIIGSLKQIAYRYEWAYMRDPTLIEASVAQHDGIIAALAENDLEQAVTLLTANWQFGMNALLQTLDWL